MIQPTVGRILWFYRSVEDASNANVQPRAAQVAYVVNDRCVNVMLLDAQGDSGPKLAVQLYQDGDPDPQGEFTCWMPYQSEQSKKEQLQSRLTISDVRSVVSEMLKAHEVEKAVQIQVPDKGPQPVVPAPSLAASGSVQPSPLLPQVKQIT